MEARQAVLYTLEHGVLPIWSVHLYCDACQINYHHNFSVYRGQRTYYRGIPDVLQVGMHQFAETRLINSWITLMLVAWVSATNCARFYNTALGVKDGAVNVKDAEWAFGGKVTPDHVYAGFTVLSLLEDCEEHSTQLIVPHTGEEKNRYNAAVAAVNHRRRITQKEVYHSCNLCTRRFPNGTKSQAVVIDGVTIGRPCCAVFNCKLPLQKNRDRFCVQHKGVDDICGIKDCSALKVPGHRTCSDPEHLEIGNAYKLRGQARFKLQQQAQQMRTGNPENSEVEAQVDLEARLDENEGPESEFTVTKDPKTGALIVTIGILPDKHGITVPGAAVPDLPPSTARPAISGSVPSPAVHAGPSTSEPATRTPSEPLARPPTGFNAKKSKGKGKKKAKTKDQSENGVKTHVAKVLKAEFGRRWTHNEQVFVWPCGVIILRETFYGAEGIGAVIELIRRVFRIPGTMPEHIFFDNNCTLKKTVGNEDPDFKNVGLTVDVFHFSCKHSVTDTFCQENCNPASYPELLGEGDKSWFFNSSIAEQTNGWLGGYFSMCKEMTPERYEFFLDEMVRRRNKETLAKLKEMGAMPINTFGLV